jgi:3-hydroxybutyryl-CoA dehydrogenase
MNTADIKTIGIVGAGLMGHGIAQVFAFRGFRVRIFDVDGAALLAVPDRIRENAVVFEELGLISSEEIAQGLDSITLCKTLPDLVDDAQVVIEAVSEKLALKRSVFKEVERHAAADALLCSNTSAISITDISQGLRRRERFLGTHFWNPPHVLPCVEVIKGQATSEQAFDTVCELLQSAGKDPVRVLKDVPGFLGNRLQHAMWREAVAMVEMGIAHPEDIDKVVKNGFGLRCAFLGPLETADLAGIDLSREVHAYLFPFLTSTTKPSPVLDEMCRTNKLGAKTGQGFHHWPEAKRQGFVRQRDETLLKILAMRRPKEKAAE